MHISTYGCQMNEHDSEIMRALLEESGYRWTDNIHEADLVVLNTCSVREHAEQRVLGLLGNLKHQKEKKPGMIIALGGCMAQNPEIQEFIRKKAPYVDVVFGTRNYHKLPALIKEAEETGSKVFEPACEDDEIPGILPVHYANRVKAYVTIIYGCNNFCTYCIVPYTRGREKSRPPKEIYEEVARLADQGFLEVMLLGQNVNSYGKDLEEDINFARLLKMLDRIPGLARIRYTTSHPRDFTDELIDTIADSEKVCEHFHLPLQAGSNNILKKMNRGYTREDYFKLTEKIRQRVPGASITTDIIVGFPGETDEDFLETLDLVRRVRFDAAYTFIYSPRYGTPAAKMRDDISQEAKKERLKELNQVQNQITLEINKTCEGKTFEILVEGRSKTNPDRWSGRTRTNKIVVFDGEEDLEGKLVNVEIECARTWTLFGSLKNTQKKRSL
ncbi:MAG TPA: tRNA (N6-isopentenyl adenosine(37)-C2)-methylthiotransferase MiaB [Syntrophomonadaceae bacterium]|nr:tRNA (N6-isopentenyl adenosine(37)-C2)-methylthiotransferase MiaB [Syntrophomonadaceae bacterium]